MLLPIPPEYVTPGNRNAIHSYLRLLSDAPHLVSYRGILHSHQSISDDFPIVAVDALRFGCNLTLQLPTNEVDSPKTSCQRPIYLQLLGVERQDSLIMMLPNHLRLESQCFSQSAQTSTNCIAEGGLGTASEWPYMTTPTRRTMSQALGDFAPVKGHLDGHIETVACECSNASSKFNLCFLMDNSGRELYQWSSSPQQYWQRIVAKVGVYLPCPLPHTIFLISSCRLLVFLHHLTQSLAFPPSCGPFRRQHFRCYTP